MLAREVAAELDARLRGMRLQALWFDPERHRVTLFAKEACVDWLLHPREGAVVVHEAREPFGAAQSLKSTILGIDALPDERIVRIQVRKTRGQSRSFTLYVELATNRRNAFLVDATNTIERALTSRAGGPRPLVRGHPYTPPPGEPRQGVAGDLQPARWNELIAEARARGSMPHVAWLSRTNWSGIEAASDGYELWQALAGLHPIEPVVLSLPTGRQPYPFPLPGVTSEPSASVLAAIATCHGDDGGPSDPELEGRLRTAARRLARRLAALRREYDQAADPGLLRSDADLLLTRLKSVPKGAAEVELEGFDGQPVLLALDPKLDARENADALYDRAGRAERARAELPARISEAEERLAQLDEALDQLGRGEAPDATVVDSLRHAPSSDKRSDGPALPYRVYRSSGGIEIWVGRGAKSNDALTFQHARPNDVWLHARDAAGAHVVLRWADADAPPARDLEDAAVVAALHSKARHSGWVPVDWTRRKHVRKPRKAPPGTVIPDRVKTVFVEPNEDRLAALTVPDA